DRPNVVPEPDIRRRTGARRLADGRLVDLQHPIDVLHPAQTGTTDEVFFGNAPGGLGPGAVAAPAAAIAVACAAAVAVAAIAVRLTQDAPQIGVQHVSGDSRLA